MSKSENRPVIKPDYEILVGRRGEGKTTTIQKLLPLLPRGVVVCERKTMASWGQSIGTETKQIPTESGRTISRMEEEISK
jgi:Mg-chelatase subunit ChlI